MSLHYKLKSLKKGDLSMRTYISQIKEVCDSLAACGNPISEVEKIATILNGLPMEYKPFVAVITASREPFNLGGVVSVLIDAEVQQNAFDLANNFSGSASIAQGTSDRAGVKNKEYSMNQQPCRQFNNSRGRGRTRPQCQLCGKVGHLVDSCWFRFDQSFQGVTARKSTSREESGMSNVNGGETNVTGHVCSCAGHGSNESQAQVQLTTVGTGQNQWYVDSGATHHVTPEAGKVMQGSEYGGPGKITVGDGANLNIAKIGKSVLPVFSSNRKTLVLSDLMHVPQITKNLISVPKLARDNHVFLEFHAFKCVVRDEDTGAVLLEGRESEGLYKFDSVIDHSSWFHADDHNIAISDDHNIEINVAGTSKLQQQSVQNNSNELLIIPGVDRIKQLFVSNEQGRVSANTRAMTGGMTGGGAESDQGGARLSSSVEVDVEHSSSRGDDEHGGSQQSPDDTNLDRTTNVADGSDQAEQMAAEATSDNEELDLDDNNGLGEATSTLNSHDDAVSGNESDYVNGAFDETIVADETEVEVEVESADEGNTNMHFEGEESRETVSI
ncbi:hypothetical protein GQ457_02G024390 [Hibiscus cannabinus]